ncbi:hypothetical protein GF324_03630 [bacterium]|nr:hypothetical protein [bacterium]
MSPRFPSAVVLLRATAVYIRGRADDSSTGDTAVMWFVHLLSLLLLTSPLAARPLPGSLPGNAWTVDRSHSAPHTVYPYLQELDADSSHEYDALHLDITLRIDPDSTHFTAVVEMEGRCLTDGLEQILLHLAECEIDSLQLDGGSADYSQMGEELIVSSMEPLDSLDTFTLRMAYTGPQRDDVSFGGLVNYPWRPHVYTNGEPYRTRYWLACYDLPYDKVTHRMTVEMPEEYDVVSNGVFLARIPFGDGWARTIWDNPFPTASYLISIAAYAPYVRIDAEPAGVNNTPLTFWVTEEEQDSAAYDFGRTGVMLERFEELFGPYPFNRYDQAMSTIFGGWGAMEHQTATTFGVHLIDGFRTYEGIVAHELAHQWWGDFVTPLTFADIWLNEGFATYSDLLFYEHVRPDEWRQRRDGLFNGYLVEHADSSIALHNPPLSRAFGATIYNKGALVLHALRWYTGDEAFFETLRQYGDAHAYGNVTTEDFLATLEQVSSGARDVIEPWIFEPGHPVYSIDNWLVSGAPGDRTVEFRVEQVQDETTRFPMKLPFRIHGESGLDTLVTAFHDGSPQTFAFQGIRFEPFGLEFDPDGRLPAEVENLAAAPDETLITPAAFSLSSPYPNPFNRSVHVTVTLPHSALIRAEVFDLLGRRVAVLADHELPAGAHKLYWSPDPATASGRYWLQLKSGNLPVQQKPLLLVK